MRNSIEPGRSPFKRRFLFPLLFAALCLAVVEIGLQAARLVVNAGKLPNRQYLLSPYAGQEWARPLFAESLASRSEFDPFVGFRERPQTGRYVNVDAQGLRRTWNPGLPPGARAPLVLVFGGSTVWGWGARDEFTIPSHLSRDLRDRDVPARVLNCGQRGYVLSQEVLQLALLLRRGVRPDAVVFYDGFNDVFFSYRAGRADSPYRLAEHTQRFEAGDLELARLGLTGWIGTNSAVVSTVAKLAARLNPAARTRYGTQAPRYTDAELERLAPEIADGYARSLDFLRHLAETYGFRCECFWQPVIFYESELTPEEAGIGPAPGDRPLGKLFVRVRELVDARGLPNFHDISDVYRGRRETVYTDFAHVSETGNRIVAARIGAILAGEVRIEQGLDRP